MKKITLIAVMLMASITTVFSQKTFWEGLDTTKVYHIYHGTFSKEVPGIEGPAAKTGSGDDRKTLESNISFKLLPNGYPYDFTILKHEAINPSLTGGNFDHRKEFKASKWSSTDNYSYPAKYLNFNSYTGDDQELWVVIDGCLIEVKIVGFNVKKLSELKAEDVTVDKAYVPVGAVAKTKEKKPKKKLSLMERIKAAKSTLGSISSTMSLSAKAKELNNGLQQKILDYLIAMEKAQKAHPYTAADKAGMQQEEDIAKGADEYVRKSNAEWEASEEGQEFRRRFNGTSSSTSSNYCTVKNEGPSGFFIAEGSLNAVHINSGSSYSFEAGKKIYYSNNNREKLSVAVSNPQAGKTYTVQ